MSRVLFGHTFPSGLDLVMGKFPGATLVHVFGRNPAVSTSFAPVTPAGVMQMPQVAGVKQLRIAAGDPADTAAGAGAREVTIYGLDASGNEISSVLIPQGATPSAYTDESYLRLNSIEVTKSGTYANPLAFSHAADIEIEDNTSATWGTVISNGVPRAVSEMGVYAIPAGKIGYVGNLAYHTDSSKVTTIIPMVRENLLETAAPYSPAFQGLSELEGTQSYSESDDRPRGSFVGPCDVGFLAKVDAGTAVVSVSFEVLVMTPELVGL